ncbi:AlpA family transcriptional regulator [Photobacterium profundum]|uniref:helix-turn-helix transcriptional regulator n=1 Tax=Photobacterium profundum TaxID=74109 RepID=UPI003D0AF37E
MLNIPKKLITLKEVIALTGLSRSTIYKYISTREFPQQIPIGERSVRWEDGEIQSWIKKKIELR